MEFALQKTGPLWKSSNIGVAQPDHWQPHKQRISRVQEISEEATVMVQARAEQKAEGRPHGGRDIGEARQIPRLQSI